MASRAEKAYKKVMDFRLTLPDAIRKEVATPETVFNNMMLSFKDMSWAKKHDDPEAEELAKEIGFWAISFLASKETIDFF